MIKKYTNFFIPHQHLKKQQDKTKDVNNNKCTICMEEINNNNVCQTIMWTLLLFRLYY